MSVGEVAEMTEGRLAELREDFYVLDKIEDGDLGKWGLELIAEIERLRNKARVGDQRAPLMAKTIEILQSAIRARDSEIDRLRAENEQYREALMRIHETEQDDSVEIACRALGSCPESD